MSMLSAILARRCCNKSSGCGHVHLMEVALLLTLAVSATTLVQHTSSAFDSTHQSLTHQSLAVLNRHVFTHQIFTHTTPSQRNFSQQNRTHQRLTHRSFDNQNFTYSNNITHQTIDHQNLTHQTLRLPMSSHCHKDFLFSNGPESYLHVYQLTGFDFTSNNFNTPRCYCKGSLEVPAGKFISIRVHPFQTSASCNNFRESGFGIIIQDNNQDNLYVRPCERLLTFFGDENKLKYKFFWHEYTKSFNVTVAVRALDVNYRKRLHVHYETNVSGTVAPYGFDGVSDYAVNIDAYAWLSTPPGHSVMVSFLHFDVKNSRQCVDDVLSFWINGTFRWHRCGEYKIPAEVYPQANLTFEFTSYYTQCYSGFQIRFSFLAASALPVKLMTVEQRIAIFNCSVPYFVTFRQNLDCNLDTECVDAEDEANCPYSQGACGPGLLNADRKCYMYVSFNSHKVVTWYEVSSLCLEQGMTLASFSTAKQEKEFRNNILSFAFSTGFVFIGLRTSDPFLSSMYREVWQWSSGIMAYHVHVEDTYLLKPYCSNIDKKTKDRIFAQFCGDSVNVMYFFCEQETQAVHGRSPKFNLTITEATFGSKENTRFVRCLDGHVTHDFLSCDHASRCGAEHGMTTCVTYGLVSVEVLMFVCDSQTQTIHYTQVCDHQSHCFDSSDETFCIHQACSEKQCKNQQCVTTAQWCDGMAHCSDGSDERCPQFVMGATKMSSRPISTPGFHVVLFDGYGKYKYVPQGKEFPVCPPTHFLCANGELCLPVYVRCNQVDDCPDREDEDGCYYFSCPGYYRCRGSAVCVHSDHVCDGVFQCPQRDDELLCELVCPDHCLCQGLAFVFPRPFPVQLYPDIRYLDASVSGISPEMLFPIHYLVRLVLSNCGLNTLPVLEFPNMKFLDLSNNNLTNVSMLVFTKLSKLNFINLSRNPIVNLVAAEPNIFWENVRSLDLSHTKLSYFESVAFWNIRNLKSLNLSHSTLKFIDNDGFGSLAHIESLDLRETELKDYPVKMLQPLSSLELVFCDVYKLCCPDVLPEHFNIRNCHTIPDEIASCKDLLRSIIYRMFLWTACSFALIGNAASFVARFYMQRGKSVTSFSVFIANLNAADFCMGLYLAVIGSADEIYRGIYLWHDEEWKTSASCQIAGFLSLLSCEMSAFIICFITLDRFLVMRFPFSQLRFRITSAGMVCGLTWIIGIALAAVPLLPVTSQWEFYSHTDICIPLPITRRNFKGRFYSFGILIVLNFIIFVLIAIGQLFIYLSIRDNSMATDQKNERETTVARRLLTVVMSDFLCWFPIGLLGLLASNDVSIPGEVNVAMAIFALPLNSALNPFLYTFNLVMEKRRKASEQRLLKILRSRMSDLPQRNEFRRTDDFAKV